MQPEMILEMREEWQQKYRDRFWRDAWVPSRYQDGTLDTLQPHRLASQSDQDWFRRLVAAGRVWADNFAAGEPDLKGLLIHGAPGRGKTSIACAIAHDAVHRSHPERLGWSRRFGVPNPPRPVQFHTLAGFLRLTKNSWDGEVSPGERVSLRGLYGESENEWDYCRLLILDNVGNEHAGKTGYATNTLHDLLRSRFHKGLYTIMTSNVSPADWRKKYDDDAFFDFLHDAAAFLPYVGPSWRIDPTIAPAAKAS